MGSTGLRHQGTRGAEGQVTCRPCPGGLCVPPEMCCGACVAAMHVASKQQWAQDMVGVRAQVLVWEEWLQQTSPSPRGRL